MDTKCRGQIAELESPAKLLEDSNSMFYSLVNEAGLVGTASSNVANEEK
jgi:hypothetical protein